MFSSVFLFSLLLCSITALTPIEKKLQIYEDCAKKHPVSKSNLEGAFDFTSADVTKDQKCFTYCLNEGYGLYNKDGSMNLVKLTESITDYFKDTEDLKKLAPVAGNCFLKQKKLPDKCDYANALFECFVDGLKDVIGNLKYTKYSEHK